MSQLWRGSNLLTQRPVAPAQSAVAVVPADGADLAVAPCRALYVGTGGDLSLILADDAAAVLFKNVASGTLLPVSPKRVRATGTTAADLVALY